MSLQTLSIAGILAGLPLAASAQETPPVTQVSPPEAPREMLAKGMAMLDGTWSGNETTRKLADAMTTTVSAGSFESRMDRESNSATVKNGDDVIKVRLEDGALVYSAAGQPGEQRRQIIRFFPVDENGDWYIAVSYAAPFTDGKLYTVEETYRMDGGVYTRVAEAAPADGSGPPMLYRWGSFRKVEEQPR